MNEDRRFEKYLSPDAAALLRELVDDPELVNDPTWKPGIPPMFELLEHSEEIAASAHDGHLGDMSTMTSSPEVANIPHPVAPLRHD